MRSRFSREQAPLPSAMTTHPSGVHAAPLALIAAPLSPLYLCASRCSNFHPPIGTTSQPTRWQDKTRLEEGNRSTLTRLTSLSSASTFLNQSPTNLKKLDFHLNLPLNQVTYCPQTRALQAALFSLPASICGKKVCSASNSPQNSSFQEPKEFNVSSVS